MSELVTRMLSVDAEPLIRPRVTSIYEPGQDLEPAVPSWLGPSGEGLDSRPESSRRVGAHVEGPAEPDKASAGSDAGAVAAVMQPVVPRGSPVLDPTLGQAPARRAPSERAVLRPDPTADGSAPVAHRSRAALAPTAVEPPAAPGRGRVASARAAEAGVPHAVVGPVPEMRAPDTMPEPTAPPVGGLLAALPGSHLVRGSVDPPPVAAYPAPSRRRPEPSSPQPETVVVTIGRVEVHASRSTEHRPPTAAAAAPARRPLMSLEDYLRGRSGGVSA